MRGEIPLACWREPREAVQVRVHVTDEAQRFLAAAGDYLATRPVEHNLVLSLAHLSQDLPEPSRWAWVTDDDGDVVGALIQAPSTYLASATPMPGTAVGALVNHLAPVAADMPGINGEDHTVATFAGAWATALRTPVQPVAGQRLYQLGSLRQAKHVAGRLRPARPDDIATLVAWDEAFTTETRMHRPPHDDRAALIAQRAAKQMFWLWEVDDQPVSMALATPPLAGASRVGGVYTPPQERGNGYASACVGALSAQLLDDGVDACLLYTQLINPTSNRIYQRLGYEPVTEILVYRFGDSSAR
jgi:GNAT superfamily N-acetyltransferase